MKTLRWIVAMAGVIAASVAIVALPTDSPRGPATAGRQELDEGETQWHDADWHVLRSTVRWAEAAQVDTLPFGEAVVAIGRRFVGYPLQSPGRSRSTAANAWSSTSARWTA
ncbi:MAG: hypothetical protein U5R14_14810 [Gemmatimonadota bacterium]|nr:hypothetical protein [Gemmatimonadota bacterium]